MTSQTKRNLPDKRLIGLAKQARRYALPSSTGFKVGAVLVAKSGQVYTGCNIEIPSNCLTICAERVALYKAISAGERVIKKVAVVANHNNPIPPCGICRQALHEFGSNIEIVMANTKGKVLKKSLNDLLPLGWKFKKGKKQSNL